jgi:hypothetical protein
VRSERVRVEVHDARTHSAQQPHKPSKAAHVEALAEEQTHREPFTHEPIADRPRTVEEAHAMRPLVARRGRPRYPFERALDPADAPRPRDVEDVAPWKRLVVRRHAPPLRVVSSHSRA